MPSIDTAKPNALKDILSQEQLNAVARMVDAYNAKDGIELEVGFKKISYVDYMRIIEHYVANIPTDNIVSTNSLDISIELKDENVFRCSITDDALIDEFLTVNINSPIMRVEKYLTNLASTPKTGVETIFKDRGSANRVMIEEIDAVFKATTETPINKAPVFTGREKILYRYKERSSFMVNELYRVDATEVKQSAHLSDLAEQPTQYELELEIIGNKISPAKFLASVTEVLQIVQDSDVPIGKSEIRRVLDDYRKILQLKPGPSLELRNVVSLQISNLLDKIPNNYAVTDKADGERHNMFVDSKGEIYIMSFNLRVKKLIIKVTDKQFQNMILDGEWVQTPEAVLFLIFDVIYAEGVDFRFKDKYTLRYRIKVINRIVSNCFDTMIPFEDYADKHTEMEIDLMREFYAKELEKYWRAFTKRIKNHEGLFIARKVYLIPEGVDVSEIFAYADILWKTLVYKDLTPYRLDGIIYTPINSPYLTTNDLPDLKWKSPNLNSIDFYIKFQKNMDGQDSIFYDDSAIKQDGPAFKIAHLFAGYHESGVEKPIPFKVNGKPQVANIYLIEGQAQDVAGNIINDATVVEFVFNNTNPDIDDAYKWIPLRTRYDKTESVQKYGKRYGNYVTVANAVWKTIITPITEDIIASLGKKDTYLPEVEKLKRINEVYTKQGYVYYQRRKKEAHGMRAFSNWIKSNLIATYARNRGAVLDIGAGIGGDLQKFIYAGVGEYVGLDIDNHGLYIGKDSALGRYRELRKRFKNIPPMYFIHADARGLFNVKSQEAIIPNLTEKNKEMIKQFLSGNKKYDIINAQFTLHYYLSDKLSWNNFCQNINDHMNDNGYLLVTTFDGDLVRSRLAKSSKYTVSYTNSDGSKNVFFDIQKAYDDADIEKNPIGVAIDLYNSLISDPGNYIREYLVFKDFLTSSLLSKCGLELVESETFSSIFDLYKNYFLRSDFGKYVHLDNTTNIKNLNNIQAFYKAVNPEYQTLFNAHEVDVAQASLKFARLYRYYVFKKVSTRIETQPARIVNLNQRINLGMIIDPYLQSNHMAVDFANRSTNISDVYAAMRRSIKPEITGKPRVFLVRHYIDGDNQTAGSPITKIQYIKRNRFEFVCVKKDNTSDSAFIIYKSPEEIFYPIYFYKSRSDFKRGNQTFLIQSSQAIHDLNLLVALTDRIK